MSGAPADIGPKERRLIAAWRSAIERLAKDRSDDGFTTGSTILRYVSRLPRSKRGCPRRRAFNSVTWTENCSN